MLIRDKREIAEEKLSRFVTCLVTGILVSLMIIALIVL